MPEIKLRADNKDDDTHLRVVDIDGYYIPTFPIEDHEKHFRSMPGWKARNDDVIISAYPKAGRISTFSHPIIDRSIKFIKCINLFKTE